MTVTDRTRWFGLAVLSVGVAMIIVDAVAGSAGQVPPALAEQPRSEAVVAGVSEAFASNWRGSNVRSIRDGPGPRLPRRLV